MPTQRATRNRYSPQASERSIGYMRSLVADRELSEIRRIGYENDLAAHDRVVNGEATPHDTVISQSDASSAIDSLKKLTRRPRTQDAAPGPAPEPVTEGFYEYDGRVYRVVKAKAPATHVYAKVLTEAGGETVVAKWSDPKTVKMEFARGMMGRLRAEHRMSVERAEELSRLTARCIRCRQPLSKDSSIDAGMGDICRSKM